MSLKRWVFPRSYYNQTYLESLSEEEKENEYQRGLACYEHSEGYENFLYYVTKGMIYLAIGAFYTSIMLTPFVFYREIKEHSEENAIERVLLEKKDYQTNKIWNSNITNR